MASASSIPTSEPQPAWEIAKLFPPQGHWSAGSYLSFTETLNQLVELVDGNVEVLEVPTKSHQKIVQKLLNLVLPFLEANRLGDAISAPYRMRLRDNSFREPDIVVYLAEHLSRCGERYGEAADLAIEVVSNDAASRTRDYEDKRRDYAAAGIPEYWIVDPIEHRILVFSLKGEHYVESGDFGVGQEVVSFLLPSFRLKVDEVIGGGGT